MLSIYQLLVIASSFVFTHCLTGPEDSVCTYYVSVSYSQSYSSRYTVACEWWHLQRCTQYRTRYRTAYRQNTRSRCCSGYRDNGRNYCSPLCFGSFTCPNGGTCSRPNYCTCRAGYYSPRCNACPVNDIANCAKMTCSSGPSNKRCIECTLQSPAGGAYHLTNNRCLTKCSWLTTRRCWPGTCNDRGLVTSCTCSTGFRRAGGNNCDLYTVFPSLLTCTTRAVSSTNEYVDSKTPAGQTSSCRNQQDYSSNFPPTSVRYTFTFQFKVDGLPSKPRWISNYHFGIVAAYTQVITYRQNETAGQCFQDSSSSRVLPFMAYGSHIQSTVETCIAACRNRRYAYAGVESSEQCFCGNSLDKQRQRPQSECNTKCTGSDDMCGGSWRLNVYSVSANTGPLTALAGCTRSYGTTYNRIQASAITCASSKAFSGIALQNGYKYCMRYEARGGGFYKTKNLVNNVVSGPYYHSHVLNSKTVCMLYDIVPPIHCSQTSSCSASAPYRVDPIGIENRITKASNVTITYGGWTDPVVTSGFHNSASGVEHLEFGIYNMIEKSANLIAVGSKIGNSTKVSNGEGSIQFTLPGQGLFAVIAEVKDIAHNVRRARRFVLYDPMSKVVVSSTHPLRVTSTAANTNYLWQTNLGRITIQWVQHFHNDFHVHNNMLRRIQSDSSVSGYYDQTTGDIPVSGTPNVYGIIEFKYGFDLFESKGIPSMSLVTPSLSTSMSITPPSMQDGRQYRIWVQAKDVMGNTLVDNTTVSVDSTPPIISDAGVVNNGKKALFVHGDSDLSKMTFEFKAMDSHSGLREVKWKLGTSTLGADLSEGSLPVMKVANSAPDSYCPLASLAGSYCETFLYRIDLYHLVASNTHQANHNREYYFTLTATNNAKLSNNPVSVKILIDTSPPTVGVVLDGDSSQDAEFQQDYDLKGTWHGFLDHESGIYFYKYAFAQTCLTQEELINNSTVTTETSGGGVASKDGKYYLNVVAYNGANEPSDVVCSNGVLVDKTAPQITDFYLHGLFVQTGIACDNGAYWYVLNNFTRVSLSNVDPCKTKCSSSKYFDVLLVPKLVDNNGTTVTYDRDRSLKTCKDKPLFDLSWPKFLATDHIRLRWNSTQRTPIHDYLVGVGTIQPPQVSTHGARFYNVLRSGIDQGQQLNILLTATTKAGTSSSLLFGQIFVDETPPIMSGQFIVDMGSKDCHPLTVSWASGAFYDAEYQNGIGLYQYAIGTESNIQAVSSFDNFVPKVHCDNFTYLSIDKGIISQHDAVLGQNYLVSLKVFNKAGLHSIFKSPTFNMAPEIIPGTVFDVLPGKTEQDVDFLLYKDYCLSWAGFKTHYGSLQYSVGLGSSKLKSDLINYRQVAVGRHYMCFVTPPLTSDFTKVYGTLRATSTIGNSSSVVVSSDGALVVSESVHLRNVDVFDGPGCLSTVEAREVSMGLLLQPSQSQYVRFSYSGFLGARYTVKLSSSDDISDVKVTQIGAQPENTFRNAKNGMDLAFFTFDWTSMPYTFNISNTGDSQRNITSVSLLPCAVDDDYQAGTTFLTGYWRTSSDVHEKVSHYECSITETACTLLACDYEDTFVPWTPQGKQQRCKFNGLKLKSGNRYRLLIRPCFHHVCLQESASNGVKITPAQANVGAVTANVYLNASFDSYAAETYVHWQRFVVINGALKEHVLRYEWTLSSSSSAKDALMSWRPVYNKTEDFAIFPWKKHRLQKMYLLMTGYSLANVATRHVKTIVIEKDSSTAVDIAVHDLSEASVGRFSEAAHATNMLTAKLEELHNAEVDFTNMTDKAYALFAGPLYDAYTWILTTEADPNLDCSTSPHCLASVNNTQNHVEFIEQLNHGTKYYTCLRAEAQTRQRTTSTIELPEVRLCSNGFVIDRNPPIIEEFSLLSLSSDNVDAQFSRFDDIVEFKFRFKDLEDSLTELSSGVKNHRYYIGTSAGQDDVVNKTNTGLQTHVIVENISLVNGKEYFVTVEAEDYAGHVTSVSSKPFQVDTTPPVTTNAKLRVGSPHANSKQLAGDMLQFHWFGFEDAESGIASYEFAIGSLPTFQDNLPFKVYSTNYALVDGVTFHDGHVYYPQIKVTNGAGLVSALSEDFVFDSTPPSRGIVRDCTSLSDLADIDYQSSTSRLCASWSGFHDAHTSLSDYKVGVEEDGIQPLLSSVGLKTAFVFAGNFKAGRKYVITVEACNSVGLCTRACSDGVVIDPTPPLAGIVTIGHRHFEHSRYQASRKFFSASWMGFQDPQSAIDRYDWCIGTSVGQCDIQPFVNVHNAHEQVRFDMTLPVGKPLFVTVRAWNKARLVVKKTSQPIVVDNTPPLALSSPVFTKGNLLSLNDNTQFETNVLNIRWNFTDTNSPLIRHIVSVTSHHDGFCPVENLDLGEEESLSVSLGKEHTLADGETYYAAVTACNDAGLCTSSNSSANVLIDSSAPHVGQFLQSYWSEETGKIKLRILWSGFVDPHSGIKQYHFHAGTNYSSYDLTNGFVKVPYTPQSGTTKQEATFILTNGPSIGSSIYISMVAENNVGLKSKILKILVRLVSTVQSNGTRGMLVVRKHSCNVPYCNNDCVCAPFGQKCNKFNVSSCTLLPRPPSNVTVSVGFATPVISAMNQRCIGAKWIAANPEHVIRYQYSLGVSGADPGFGVFNLTTETVWHNIDLWTNTTFCLPQGQFFQTDPPEKYVVYVRAWFSSSTLAQFKSPDLTIDTSAPTQRQGRHVLDCRNRTRCDKDIEFSTDTTTLTASWENVFVDIASGIKEYEVMMGVFPGDSSVKPKFRTTVSSHSESGLSLVNGLTYYTTVKAINSVGLTTIVSSDGVTIDNEAPLAGTVYNTKDFHSVSATAGSCIGASWEGFDDLHSHIMEYYVGIEEMAVRNNVLVNQVSVGIKNAMEFCNLNLKQNTAYAVVVRAKDAAGIMSGQVLSYPILVDKSPPAGFRCTKWVSNPLTPESTVLAKDERNTMYEVGIEANTLYELVFRCSGDIPKASLEFLGVHHVLHFLDLAGGGSLATYTYTSSVSMSTNFTLNLVTTSQNVSVTLKTCSNETISEPGSSVILRQLGPLELLLSFYVKDPESGIRQHLAGVGTTIGGFQVAKLRSLGQQQHMVYDVNLPHGTPVFATVISDNNAGSRTYFRSNKLVVDHMPPTISNLTLTINLVEETTCSLVTTWTADDPESGVNTCQLQIGDAPHTGTIQPLVTVASASSIYQSTRTSTLSHGQQLYATVWCSNYAELSSSAVSKPDTAICQKPSSSGASVWFLMPQNIYDGSPEIIPDTNYLHVAWTGFQDSSGQLTYKVRLLEGTREFQPWVDVGPRTDFSFSNLSLTEHECYKVDVQAFNSKNLPSSIVSRETCVDSGIPTLTGQQPQLNLTRTSLTVNWYPAFVHDVNLWYVACIGFSEGACDILQPIETTKSFITLDVDGKGLTAGEVLFGVITAVKPSGVFKLFKFSATVN